MGILNVTPDSFSDGARWVDPAAAVAHGRDMVAAGAAVIDIGGESTRPGATGVGQAEEMRRVLPVIEALAGETVVSVDTRHAAVARAAVAAGASIINDVSAELWPVAAETGAGWVAMHMPADPSVMQERARYDDVVGEVLDYLVTRAEKAAAAGVARVWIDPGIGFAKNAEQILSLLRHLDRFVATGWPVLVGTSRKSFLGRVTARPGQGVPGPDDRLEASVATAAWAVLAGAAMVRVHDVAPAAMACRLAPPGSTPRRPLAAPSGRPHAGLGS
jgi:dihydropteroate synthase